MKQKLEEKQRIDEEIKEVDTVLQNKNVKIKTINEYTKLNEKLNKNGLSTQDVKRLVKFVMTAKRYGFCSKNVGAKMSNIKQLEKRQKELVRSSMELAKQNANYRAMIPLALLIYDLHISKSELISFKVAVNVAADIWSYSFRCSSSCN